MEYGSGLVMFKERDKWCLSRIVVDLAMPTRFKRNLITMEETKTVLCTGRLIDAGNTSLAQPKLVLYAQGNNSLFL